MVRVIREAAPAIVANAKLGNRLQNALGVRRAGVHDAAGDHRHFESLGADDFDKGRQVARRTVGFHMAPLAHRQVDAIEAELGRGLGKLPALQKMEMLREDGNLQLSLGGKECAITRQQSG